MLVLLADYATMHGPARPVDGDGQATDTILAPFDRDSAPPAELTAFDTACLAALYAGRADASGLSKVLRVGRELQRQADAEAARVAREGDGLGAVQQAFIGSMHNSPPIERHDEVAMRALRFGLAIALSAAVALGVYTTYPGNAALALTLAQASLLAKESDSELDSTLAAMVASAEIGPDGEVLFGRALGDDRFLEPNSGRYWQVSGEGHEDFRSRSLWERRLELGGRASGPGPIYYDSDQFADEPLRIAERSVRLPGSHVEWRFAAARSRNESD